MTDIALLKSRLEDAVRSALDFVAEDVKREMGQQLAGFSFPRSRGSGGLSDPGNFDHQITGSGDSFTLTVRDMAPLQSGGGAAGDLGDAVESGDPAYRMPGTRPFYQNTENAVSSRLDAVLENGLKTQGF